MDAPKPIETRYAECRFRSRLEARWAVFLDALRVPWEYEAQGFTLPDGTAYLPDFWLPVQRIWLEVRAEKDERLETVKRFTEALPRAQRCVVAFGDIPRPSALDRGGRRLDRPSVHGHPDSEPAPSGYLLWLGPILSAGQADSCEMPAAFCSCPTCGRFDIQPVGIGAAWSDCGCDRDELADIDFCHIETKREADLVRPYFTARDVRLLAAFQRARSARFEHGETPDRFGP